MSENISTTDNQKFSDAEKKNLSEEIERLSKRFPEVSFAKLSRICVHIARWQKAQDEKKIEDALDKLSGGVSCDVFSVV